MNRWWKLCHSDSCSRKGFIPGKGDGIGLLHYAATLSITRPEHMVAEATMPLREDLLDDLAVHVGQPEVAALELDRQPPVIDAKQVEHGCVQVEDFADVFHCVVAKFVGVAVRDAAFDAA